MGKKYTTDEIEVGGHMLDASMMTSLNTVVTDSSNYMTTLPSHNHDDRYVKEGGTSFSGVYPMVVRTGARSIYSDQDITFTGSSSQLYVSGSVRTPTLYDSNNTNYYVNPASTSNLNGLNAVNVTLTGDLQVDGQITQAGVVDRVSWGRTYSASNTTIATLVTKDGGALPTGGAYRMTGHISGTGTDQVSMAVFWNEDGTWYCNNTFAGGASSNHIEFLISDSVPKVKTWHSNNYSIHVAHERLSLNETGTDNLRGYFGSDSFLKWTESTNSLVVPGTISATSGTSTEWNTAYGWGDHAGLYAAASHSHSYLPLSGGTLTGTLAANGGIHMGNTNLTNVNHITINDPGSGEGIEWLGGNGWKIFESSDSNSNGAGNLQFSVGSVHKFRVDTSGHTTSMGSSRAPIFYDSNNTAYYLDPAGTSKMHTIWTVGSGANSGPRWDTSFHVVQSQHWYGHGDSQTMYLGESSNPVRLRGSLRIGSNANADSGMALTVNGSANATTSFRAPIFYDSDNTGYYVNPASTSSMYRLELNNHIDMRAQTSTWIEADVMTDAIGWNTSYGVYIGSNIGGTHYLRGNGTFTTGGSTYNLYHTGNLTAAAIGASAVGHVHSYLPLSGGTLSGNLDVNADIQANTYTQAAHGIPRNNLGAPTVTEMALFDNQFTPKTTLANDYDDLSDLTFWKQETSSSAWVEITTFSDDQKRRFLRTKNSNIAIPNGVYKFRVEFVGKGYTFANAMYAYWSSQSHNTQVHVWKYNVNSSSWIQHTSSSATVASWPGHLYLPFSTIPWLESATTHTGHYKSLRIEFTPTWSTGTYSDRTINLHGMEIWGGYPSGSREPHYYDQDGQLNIVKNLSVAGDLKAPVLYDSDNTSYYLNPASTSNLNGLLVNGNTVLGSSNGNTTRVNDTLYVEATDSGDSHFYFGENSSGGNGTYWNWDSGHRHTWYSRHAGTNTSIMYHNTNDTSYLYFTRAVSMSNKDINHVNQLHFNDNVRFYDDGNDSYLNFKYGDGGAGGIKIRDNGNGVKGYLYADTGGFGLLDNDGHWAVRTQTGTNPLELRCDNNTEFQVYNSYTLSPGSSRAPTFYDSNNTGYYVNPAETSNLNSITSQGTSNFRAKRHNFGLSSGWDSVGFSHATNLHMNGHNQFWIGAGNGTWFTGAPNTKTQASGLAADASSSHDLLINTMESTSSIDRGITFAVDNTGAGTSGWRLGKFHSGTDATDSMFAVDGQIRAKGGYDDEYDYFADDYSSYYNYGRSHWSGDTAAGWHKPSIVASSAIQIQSGNKGTNTRKPQIQFHQYGYGGPAIEYDGPNKKLQIGMTGGSSADRFNTFSLKFGNNEAFKVNTDYASHNSDMRAPIFYDYDNTAYYLNPYGYSNLQGMQIGSGDLKMYENGTYSSELRFQNNTHHMGIDYQNNETLRFITRSGVTTVPITFQMRAGTITAANFILSSDERKKTKIADLACDNIDVSWKSFEMKDNEGEYRTGVIAQELEQKHPEFVNTNDEGFKSVKYIDLLIAKIAELEARLEKLEK